MRALVFLIVLFPLGPVAAQTGKSSAPQKPKTLLFVGNSFTDCNGGMDTHVAKLAESATQPRAVVAVRAVKEGATLKVLYETKSVRDKIRAGGFNVVVVQGDIPEVKERKIEQFKKYVRLLDREISKKDATPVLFMAWPYKRLDWVTLEEIASAHRDIGNELGVRVAPVGLAFQLATRERPELKVLGDDREHENMHGTLLAASVIYATVFGENPESCTYRPGQVTPDEAAFLKRVAWKTVNKWKTQKGVRRKKGSGLIDLPFGS